MATLIHELAHALCELDRQRDDPALTYAEEELVVESVAYAVTGAAGLDVRLLGSLPGVLGGDGAARDDRADGGADRPPRQADRGRPRDGRELRVSLASPRGRSHGLSRRPPTSAGRTRTRARDALTKVFGPLREKTGALRSDAVASPSDGQQQRRAGVLVLDGNGCGAAADRVPAGARCSFISGVS